MEAASRVDPPAASATTTGICGYRSSATRATRRHPQRGGGEPNFQELSAVDTSQISPGRYERINSMPTCPARNRGNSLTAQMDAQVLCKELFAGATTNAAVSLPTVLQRWRVSTQSPE